MAIALGAFWGILKTVRDYKKTPDKYMTINSGVFEKRFFYIRTPLTQSIIRFEIQIFINDFK